MIRKRKENMVAFVFDKILFDASLHRYTLKLSSSEKEGRLSVHVPLQVSLEEGVSLSFLLTDPLLRKLFKVFRFKVGDLVLWQHEGFWKGEAEILWGLWRKRIDLRPLDVIRFSVEFHKPILVPREMARSIPWDINNEEKKPNMKALFMPRFMGRGTFPHEEIM